MVPAAATLRSQAQARPFYEDVRSQIYPSLLAHEAAIDSVLHAMLEAAG